MAIVYKAKNGKVCDSLEKMNQLNKELMVDPQFAAAMRLRLSMRLPEKMTLEEYEDLKRPDEKSVEIPVQDLDLPWVLDSPKVEKPKKNSAKAKSERTYVRRVPESYFCTARKANGSGMRFQLSAAEVDELLSKECCLCGSDQVSIVSLADEYVAGKVDVFCESCEKILKVHGSKENVISWVAKVFVRNVKKPK